MKYRGLLSFALLVACGLHAEDFVYETASVRYVLGSDGFSKSLLEKGTKKEWLAPGALPMFAVRKAGKEYPVSALRREDNLLRASFGASGVSAAFSITTHSNYLLVELVSFQGDGVEEIQNRPNRRSAGNSRHHNRRAF